MIGGAYSKKVWYHKMANCQCTYFYVHVVVDYYIIILLKIYPRLSLPYQNFLLQFSSISGVQSCVV